MTNTDKQRCYTKSKFKLVVEGPTPLGNTFRRMFTMKELLALFAVFALLAPGAYGQKKDEETTQILIKNVKIFDGTNSQLRNGPVLIENSLIKAIGAGATSPG